MAADNENAAPPPKNKNGLDEREIRIESGKAAQKSQELKQRAYELRQAAHGAADAEERQKLLEEAIDNEFKAESFGKTARYMRSGTFQGMAVGTGLGVIPGLTLGTVVGTLVGGVTSAILGGLGAGIGALAGAIHGPFWNMGKVLGKGVRKVTGDFPSWAATEPQKKTLETMIGHIQDEDMPDEEELDKIRQEGEADDWWGSMYETGTSYMPSMPSWMKSKKGKEQKTEGNAGQQQKENIQPQNNQTPAQPSSPRPPKQGAGQDVARQLRDQDASQTGSQENDPPLDSTRNLKMNDGQQPTIDNKTPRGRGKPRKLEVRSANGVSVTSAQSKNNERKPRKIERRS